MKIATASTNEIRQKEKMNERKVQEYPQNA